MKINSCLIENAIYFLKRDRSGFCKEIMERECGQTADVRDLKRDGEHSYSWPLK
jgi:hypothetical protein